MTRRSDKVYLQHVRDHALKAISMPGDMDQERLSDERVLHLALLHLVEIVGEAASRVTAETRARLDHLPWKEMVAMRN